MGSIPQPVIDILKMGDNYAAVPLGMAAVGMLYTLIATPTYDQLEAKQKVMEEHQEKLEEFAVEEPRYGGIYMKR